MVGVLVALAIGVSTIQAMADGQAPVFSQFVGTMLFGLLLLILLCVPLLVVAFFAPTLGTLAGNGVLACVRKSIAADLKNWKALLVNCAVGCGVLLLASFVLSGFAHFSVSGCHHKFYSVQLVYVACTRIIIYSSYI